MSEFLNGRETDEFYDSLRSAMQSLFGGRLDLTHIRQHTLTFLTATEKTEISYTNPALSLHVLSGFVDIVHWKPNLSLESLSPEDREADYDSESLVLVDRRNYYFDLCGHDYSSFLTMCKCIPCDIEMYEPVEEPSTDFIPDDTGENPQVELMQDEVDMRPSKITYEDKEQLIDIFFNIGVLL